MLDCVNICKTVLSINMLYVSVEKYFHWSFCSLFTPQPLRAVGVLFSPMVSGWLGGRAAEKVCPGCILETIRYRKLILGRDIGWGCRCAVSWCDLDLTFDLAVVTYISETVRCRKLILGREIGWGSSCATLWCYLDLTFDVILTMSFKILAGLCLDSIRCRR